MSQLLCTHATRPSLCEACDVSRSGGGARGQTHIPQARVARPVLHLSCALAAPAAIRPVLRLRPPGRCCACGHRPPPRHGPHGKAAPGVSNVVDRALSAPRPPCYVITFRSYRIARPVPICYIFVFRPRHGSRDKGSCARVATVVRNTQHGITVPVPRGRSVSITSPHTP